jgi:hypothetical protein
MFDIFHEYLEYSGKEQTMSIGLAIILLAVLNTTAENALSCYGIFQGWKRLGK